MKTMVMPWERQYQAMSVTAAALPRIRVRQPFSERKREAGRPPVPGTVWPGSRASSDPVIR